MILVAWNAVFPSNKRFSLAQPGSVFTCPHNTSWWLLTTTICSPILLLTVKKIEFPLCCTTTYVCKYIFIYFICPSSPSEYQPITHWNISTAHSSPCFNIWGVFETCTKERIPNLTYSGFLDRHSSWTPHLTLPQSSSWGYIKPRHQRKAVAWEILLFPNSHQPELPPTFPRVSQRDPSPELGLPWPQKAKPRKKGPIFYWKPPIPCQAPEIRGFHREYLAGQSSEPTRSRAPNTARILPLEWNKKPFWAQESRTPLLPSGTLWCLHNANQAEFLLERVINMQGQPGLWGTSTEHPPAPRSPQLPPVFIWNITLCNN